jgi:endoglucanase
MNGHRANPHRATASQNLVMPPPVDGASSANLRQIRPARRSPTMPIMLGCLALAVLCPLRHSTATEPPPAAARYPFPQHVRLAEGARLPHHRPQDELDQDVRDFYEYWKDQYLVAAGDSDGGPLFRIAFEAGSARTVSEGQGYGMLIVALMAGHDPDAQPIFDGLWRFAAAHPSRGQPDLMSWQVAPGVAGDSSAFDGDADIAYSLLLADQQWGSQDGADYRAAALKVIAALETSCIGPESHLPLLGNWVRPDGARYNQFCFRSSDYLPTHFEAFALATQRDKWQQVLQQTRQWLRQTQLEHAPATGLVPDFVLLESGRPLPVAADFLEGPHDGDYYYNAGRFPWRVGAHAVLTGDAHSRQLLSPLTTWLRQATGDDPTRVRAGYRLDGTPIGLYFSTLFVAPFGVAAMLEPPGDGWLENIYESVRQQRQNYFEDSVSLLCLIVMTGNHWDASQPPASRLPANQTDAPESD